MLTTYAGKLLRVGQRLALSAYCCCTGRWCQTFFDECGNMFKKCVAINTGVECNANCGPPPREEPCECGPNTPCPECFECIDGKCVRIEDCCADGTPCPECSKCENGTCVPCGECEQCIDGFCLPCGPCQTCVDGECVPCPEACVDGVCVPNQYYCCYDECPGGEDEYGNPLPPPTSHCQPYPCGMGEDQNGEDCSLTKGGPYSTINLCQQNCQKYKCILDACGNGQCVPDPEGSYSSMMECLAGCVGEPCSQPCTFTGANAPGIYAIDACERDICVSYVSPDSRPIRVQIWGPTLDANCNVIASDVIKADSGWRGEECCDCESRPGGALAGGPKGQITWNKPRGATFFRVAVLTACGSSANIDIACSDQCFEYPDPEMCQCPPEGCPEGCHCCCDKCQSEPCRDNCDEFAQWTLEATFCGQTLIWSSDPTQNNSPIGFRLNYAGGYICTARGGGFGWNCGNYPPELTLDPSCFLECFDEECLDNPAPNPNAQKCIGRLEVLATGPAVGGAGFCIQTYQADIVNGELVNIVRPITPATGGNCDCPNGDEIEVTLTYNPLP